MHPAAMADLEEHALRRDGRFLVRVVGFVLTGAVIGSILFAKMTSPEVGTCAARAFGDAATNEAAPAK